jgi:hypothetical protein
MVRQAAVAAAVRRQILPLNLLVVLAHQGKVMLVEMVARELALTTVRLAVAVLARWVLLQQMQLAVERAVLVFNLLLLGQPLIMVVAVVGVQMTDLLAAQVVTGVAAQVVTVVVVALVVLQEPQILEAVAAEQVLILQTVLVAAQVLSSFVTQVHSAAQVERLQLQAVTQSTHS